MITNKAFYQFRNMKRFLLAAVAWMSSWVHAQEPADALRYSWTIASGTARQQAIGGAMGSLGGDLSALYVNPAGLAFYRTGDLVLTPAFHSLKNNATYYNRTESDNKNYLSFGASGLVMGNPDAGRRNKKKSSAFAIAFNRTAGFGNNLLYRGAQNQSSYSQKFLEEIQNQNVKDANAVAQNFPFGTSLAFNTYWIDTIGGGSAGNYQFQTRAPVATGLLQENRIGTKGGIYDLSLGGAANYDDKLYVGGSLSVPFLYFKRSATFTEADATEDINNKFDFASITENLTTGGVGFNIKAGVIYKPAEKVRLGLAFHSPTFFFLSDEYNASVTTHTESYQGLLTQSSGTFTGGSDAEFRYTLMTPYRLIASFSYVLREVEDVSKQKGFLTADIEFVNYKAASFLPDERNSDDFTRNYLKSVNRAIDNAYKGTFNFRAGGELKFTTIMLRLGGAYYGNPYRNIHGENGSVAQFSGGLGYRHKGMFIDLTYVHRIAKDVHFPYRLQYAPYSGASIKTTGGNVVFTVGFKI
jgi:hypothetical protein